MKLSREHCGKLFLFLIVTALVAACSNIQQSLAIKDVVLQKESQNQELIKKLIGIWEGNVSSPSGNGWSWSERVLVISEVNGQFYMRYGLTLEKLHRVRSETMIIDGQVTIFFKSSYNGQVQLSLVRDNWMVGTLNVTDNGSFVMSLVKIK